MIARLVLRHPPGLADVERLEPRELLGVLVDDVGEREQELHAVLRRLVPPLDPGLLGRRDGALGVLGRAARHLRDHLAGGGVRAPPSSRPTTTRPTRRRRTSCAASPTRSLRTPSAGRESPRAYHRSRSRARHRRLTVRSGRTPAHEDPRRRHRRRRLGLRPDRAAALRSSSTARSPTTTPRGRRRSSTRSTTDASARTRSTRRASDAVVRADPRDEGRRGAEQRRPGLQRADLRRVLRGGRHVPRHGDDALRAAPDEPVRGDRRQARRLPVRARRGLGGQGPAGARRDRDRARRRGRVRPPRRRRAVLARSTRSASATAPTSSSRATTSRPPSRSGRRSRSASTRR